MLRWLMCPSLIVMALGCSCTTNNTFAASCGPGTVLVDGSCVPARDAAEDTESTDSSSWDASEADSTAEADAGPEPADSTAPELDAAMEGGDVSDGSPAEGDVAALEVSILDAGDAAPEAAVSGDPCPASALSIDCSGACGGVGDCSLVSCFKQVATTEPPRFRIADLANLPIVIRTPNNPGTDPLCQPRCGAGNTVYGIGFRFNFPWVKRDGIRVRVAAPWKIYHYSPYVPHCITPASPVYSACYFHDASTGFGDYLVATTDPTAPARNIYIEPVAPGGARCDGL